MCRGGGGGGGGSPWGRPCVRGRGLLSRSSPRVTLNDPLGVPTWAGLPGCGGGSSSGAGPLTYFVTARGTFGGPSVTIEKIGGCRASRWAVAAPCGAAGTCSPSCRAPPCSPCECGGVAKACLWHWANGMHSPTTRVHPKQKSNSVNFSLDPFSPSSVVGAAAGGGGRAPAQGRPGRTTAFPRYGFLNPHCCSRTGTGGGGTGGSAGAVRIIWVCPGPPVGVPWGTPKPSRTGKPFWEDLRGTVL